MVEIRNLRGDVLRTVNKVSRRILDDLGSALDAGEPDAYRRSIAREFEVLP